MVRGLYTRTNHTGRRADSTMHNVNALLAVIAVLGVSASAPLMAATPAPALAIAMWRNAAATAILAPAAVVSIRPRDWHLRDLATCVFAGAMLAGHFGTWVTALKLTSVAAATALVSTQIVWVVAIERLSGRRVGLLILLGIGCALAGVFTITGFDLRLSTRAMIGDGLAVAGGIFSALYLLAGESVRSRLPTTAYTTVCYGSCASILAVIASAAGVELTGLPLRAWLLISAVTLTAQLLGHSLLNFLLAVIGSRVVAMLLLLEVPGAALLAGVFLHQSPAWGVYVGIVLILGGLAIVIGRRRTVDPVSRP